MINPLDLTGKNIMITGASSGIGRGTAVVLSQLGAALILSGRRESALGETLSNLDSPQRHKLLVGDVASDDFPNAVKSFCAQEGILLNGMVHSAGVSDIRALGGLSRKGLDSVLLPNTYAALRLTGLAASKKVFADAGSIVLLSSVSSSKGAPGFAVYAASKGALDSMVKSAALELCSRKIRVNCVAPGYVDTPMLDDIKNTTPEGFDRAVQQHVLGLPTVEEVGTLIAYLLADVSRTVTGTTVRIDGGFTC